MWPHLWLIMIPSWILCPRISVDKSPTYVFHKFLQIHVVIQIRSYLNLVSIWYFEVEVHHTSTIVNDNLFDRSAITCVKHVSCNSMTEKINHQTIDDTIRHKCVFLWRLGLQLLFSDNHLMRRAAFNKVTDFPYIEDFPWSSILRYCFHLNTKRYELNQQKYS